MPPTWPTPGDYENTDIEVSSDTNACGTFSNIRKFTLPAGLTVTVTPWDGSPPTGGIEINAREILIAGILEASGSGYRGGAGGGGAYGTPGPDGWGTPGQAGRGIRPAQAGSVSVGGVGAWGEGPHNGFFGISGISVSPSGTPGQPGQDAKPPRLTKDAQGFMGSGGGGGGGGGSGAKWGAGGGGGGGGHSGGGCIILSGAIIEVAGTGEVWASTMPGGNGGRGGDGHYNHISGCPECSGGAGGGGGGAGSADRTLYTGGVGGIQATGSNGTSGHPGGTGSGEGGLAGTSMPAWENGNFIGMCDGGGPGGKGGKGAGGCIVIKLDRSFEQPVACGPRVKIYGTICADDGGHIKLLTPSIDLRGVVIAGQLYKAKEKPICFIS